MSGFDPIRFNPLSGNPLRTRGDVERALRDCFDPLRPYFSPGGARVRLSANGAHFDRAAADLEGFARPLWGLAPLAAGGGDLDIWDPYRQGLAHGTDPAHAEYWGAVGQRDQRLVELAAIGLAMRLVPHLLWGPLDARAKQTLAAYLLAARRCDYADNNWKFFRVMLDLGLERCGIAFDPVPTRAYLDELDGFYLGEGWYRDGNTRQLDHYVAFAMHFYGLLYAGLAQNDDDRARRYRERAARFSRDFSRWFDADGGALAFGRSLTYRFAMGGFWGALAFANLEALPWGEIKGLYLRHLRWWSQLPIADRDGVLSLGYGYPNLLMSESYNSAGSPFWAFKAFLPLALPATHPFWQAEEQALAADDPIVPLRHPGMVTMRTKGNVVALSSGQQNPNVRAGAEKYAKFAYSSRYAFSVEADAQRYDHGAFDGALALSDDDRHFRMREDNETARIAGTALFARWRPWPDVVVETWLLPAPPWHLRLHRITTPRPLGVTEGGFAVARADADTDLYLDEPGRAVARTPKDLSAIIELSPLIRRDGRAFRALPNTHLIWSKTIVPQLRGSIAAGTTVLATAALALPAGPDAEAALAQPPAAPDLAALEALFAAEGVEVGALC